MIIDDHRAMMFMLMLMVPSSLSSSSSLAFVILPLVSNVPSVKPERCPGDANEIVSYSVAKTKHDSMILWAYWVVFQRFPYIVTALDKKLLYPRQGHR